MPVEALTDLRVKAAKPPATGILELWDSKCVGLCLRIMASGVRSWSFRYRPRGGGGFRRVTFGKYPALTLSEARERGDTLRLAVRAGSDPQHDTQMQVSKRRDEEQRQTLTFNEIADLYIERYAKQRKASWANDAGYLRRHCRPEWGNYPAHSITKQDAARLVGDIKQRTPIGANRTRSVLAKVFAWAIDEGYFAANPMTGVKKPHREGKGRDRVLTDDELRVLWRALETGGLADGTLAALQVLALLGQRPGEVAGMHRSEINNLEREAEARWEIPPERMKGRRPHVVPLPPMAREIILRQVKRKDEGEGFVFASRFNEKQRLARHSLSQAMRRVIAALEAKGADAETVKRLQAKPPTPHDLRRTLATRLAELGFPREDRLAIIAHTWGDVHEAHYDRYERLREKRVALETWERHVAGVLGRGGHRTTVVPSARGRP
jgi:integrase